MDLQLFGPGFPPLYGIEGTVDKINEIQKIDEKINALFIEREAKTEELNDLLKDADDTTVEDTIETEDITEIED